MRATCSLQERVGANAPAEQRAALARPLIGFDATHEGAARALMRALADLGERAQALREFERCREALKLSLDVEPSRETQALCDAIRAMPARTERAGRSPASPPPGEPASILPFPAKAARRGRLRVGVLPFVAAGSAADETLAFSLGHASKGWRSSAQTHFAGVFRRRLVDSRRSSTETHLAGVFC